METNDGDTGDRRAWRARIRDGDAGAFGEVFDAYARSVYNHAFRLTGDWSTAEDIVSLTFLEAWRLRGRLDAEGGSPRPWLLGIATNVARNTRRAGRRHTAAVARLPRPESVRDFADEVAGNLDDQAYLRAVRTAVDRLRRPEREVLALCAWGGLDYAAAAEALGIPVGTVRSRLSRARAKLAAQLAAGERGAGNRDAREQGAREPDARRGQTRDGRASVAGPIQEGNP
ncbi:RNA polymerase sigma factor [Streptomyces sp. DSM 3412]|uniref:RNA polymerase sigma factor n=1 Tax=Streptomyces gottesmaniae TaxID=3075518 RepID=A0ABU2ZD45_9ACTN|nr:RNA polymerase sigma factor [Streptomyces sp. DSM 3412]MDT0573524.1 RNA polymerase sigma factor [Streptomyces sp. DSM 3412]